MLLVITKEAFPVPPALDAPSVTVEVPAALRVPMITPVAVSILNPEGRPDALKLDGLPVAVMA